MEFPKAAYPNPPQHKKKKVVMQTDVMDAFFMVTSSGGFDFRVSFMYYKVRSLIFSFSSLILTHSSDQGL